MLIKLSPVVMYLLAILFFAPCSQAEEPGITQVVQQVGIDQNLNANLPLELEFRDESGKTVKLGDYFTDKPVILSFVYFRCPMLCTQVLNGVLKTSNVLKLRLSEDYDIVSVSIDPRETPEMAAAKRESYVKKYRRPGGPQGWHFLTGSAEAIRELTAVAGFRYHYDEKSDQFAHASGILVITPEGKISRYFYGIDYHPTDLRLGLVESSAGRIGTPVDQILLLCYHYDPTTGRYGLVISGVIRTFGTVTALGMALFLWSMYRVEQRRTASTLAREMTASEERVAKAPESHDERESTP